MENLRFFRLRSRSLQGPRPVKSGNFAQSNLLNNTIVNGDSDFGTIPHYTQGPNSK